MPPALTPSKQNKQTRPRGPRHSVFQTVAVAGNRAVQMSCEDGVTCSGLDSKKVAREETPAMMTQMRVSSLQSEEWRMVAANQQHGGVGGVREGQEGPCRRQRRRGPPSTWFTFLASDHESTSFYGFKHPVCGTFLHRLQRACGNPPFPPPKLPPTPPDLLSRLSETVF